MVGHRRHGSRKPRSPGGYGHSPRTHTASRVAAPGDMVRRAVEAGGHLCRASAPALHTPPLQRSHPEPLAWGHLRRPREDLRVGRPHSVPGQPVPQLGQPHRRGLSFRPAEPPALQFVPTASCPGAGPHQRQPGFGSSPLPRRQERAAQHGSLHSERASGLNARQPSSTALTLQNVPHEGVEGLRQLLSSSVWATLLDALL